MSSIKTVQARKILDSRGEWTLEVRVVARDGSFAKASVPQGRSRGAYEANTIDADEAVIRVEEEVAPALKSRQPHRQEHIDALLKELDGTKEKSRIGANTILATSLAVARLAALQERKSLWRYIRRMFEDHQKHHKKPRLYINLINGGVHARNNLEFQEYLVIPRSHSYVRATEIGVTLYHRLGTYFSYRMKGMSIPTGDEAGFDPPFSDSAEPFRIIRHIAERERLLSDIDLGLDAAASELHRSPKDLARQFRIFKEYYHLLYLEDPFDQNSFEDFALLTADLGGDTIIAGDDLTTTNTNRMGAAQARGSVNGVIIKPNQIGTLTETLEAVRLARSYGWWVICSHRSGETTDDFIADLAYGVGADGLKLGAPAHGERVAKYNRLLEIEREDA